MLLVFLASMVASASGGPADPNPAGANTTQTGAAVEVARSEFVYAEPGDEAPVIRRVYPGEVLQVTGAVLAANGEQWSCVALGYEREGFVRSASLSQSPTTSVRSLRPQRIVREDRPVAFAFRVGGESLGASLMARYQRFSRVGVTVGIGSVIATSKALGLPALSTTPRARGMTYSAALSSFLMLGNISPYLELGLARVNYELDGARLSLTNFFTSVGVEAILDMGAFVGVGVTFSRSVQSRVSFAYRGPSQAVDVPDFGVLRLDDGTFHAVAPAVHVGYAF